MASTGISIKVNGKSYKAKLSAKAIETVESQFGDEGIGKLLLNRMSFRVLKATICAAVMAENSAVDVKTLADDCDQEIEENGMENLVEACMNLYKASGLAGKEAKAKALGN